MVMAGQVSDLFSDAIGPIWVLNCRQMLFFFPAHSGAVRGVAVNGLNQLTFTSGSDWLLKFWGFKSKKLEEQLKLNAAAARMTLHRER